MSETPELPAGTKFTLEVEISDNGRDSDDQYYVNVPQNEHGDFDQVYIDEDFILKLLRAQGDRPIKAGDLVRRKNERTVGKVVAIKKGYAWVDWDPDGEDYACSANTITSLVLHDPEDE